jgi:peptidoglycan/LPS O-acetylase OafA/YrhL
MAGIMKHARAQTLSRIQGLVGKHVPALDGWRGLAILLVIFHNASYVVDRDGTLASSLYHTAGETGWVGVSIFFVLSGFLITGILVDTLGRPGYFRDFYIRRTLRIFPLYYATLIVAFLLVPLFVQGSNWAGLVERDQWWFWLYLSNWHIPADYGIPGFGHFWSLAVEEQFYLVWPALLFLTGRRLFPWVAVAVVSAAPVLRWWLLHEGLSASAPYGFTIARMDGLAVGALLAMAVRDRRWLERLYRINLPLSLALIGGILGMAVLEAGFPPRTPASLILGQSLVSVLTASLMVWTLGGASRGERWLAAAMETGWLRELGKYSYALYVFHLPIHLLLWGSARAFIDGTSVAWHTPLAAAYALTLLLLSLGAARMSWTFLEGPMLKMKDTFAPRRAPATP